MCIIFLHIIYTHIYIYIYIICIYIYIYIYIHIYIWGSQQRCIEGGFSMHFEVSCKLCVRDIILEEKIQALIMSVCITSMVHPGFLEGWVNPGKFGVWCLFCELGVVLDVFLSNFLCARSCCGVVSLFWLFVYNTYYFDVGVCFDVLFVFFLMSVLGLYIYIYAGFTLYCSCPYKCFFKS